MTNERLMEIEARCAAAMPGPWFWNMNPGSKHIELQSSGVPMRETVMAFQRWGMQGATVVFNVNSLLRKAIEFGRNFKGRDHHADWAQTLDHPDANFIAHSRQDMKDLLEYVEQLEGDVRRRRGVTETMPKGEGICLKN